MPPSFHLAIRQPGIRHDAFEDRIRPRLLVHLPKKRRKPSEFKTLTLQNGIPKRIRNERQIFFVRYEIVYRSFGS